MYNFDPYNVLLAIATNIPVLLMTAFVLQGHITHINHIYSGRACKDSQCQCSVIYSVCVCMYACMCVCCINHLLDVALWVESTFKPAWGHRSMKAL